MDQFRASIEARISLEKTLKGGIKAGVQSPIAYDTPLKRKFDSFLDDQRRTHKKSKSGAEYSLITPKRIVDERSLRD